MALLLTGALHGTRNQVAEYLKVFKPYDWLWKDDMEAQYRKFMMLNPSIEDFEGELKRFLTVEKEITSNSADPRDRRAVSKHGQH